MQKIKIYIVTISILLLFVLTRFAFEGLMSVHDTATFLDEGSTDLETAIPKDQNLSSRKIDNSATIPHLVPDLKKRQGYILDEAGLEAALRKANLGDIGAMAELTDWYARKGDDALFQHWKDTHNRCARELSLYKR